MIEEKILLTLYQKKKFSMKEISTQLKCSPSKVSYWMNYYKIKRRTISEGVYVKNNINGDPFRFREPTTLNDAVLYGIGIGLYWGEGTKANKYSIRLGNTDPYLIEYFIQFLEHFFSIQRHSLRFGIQLFSNMNQSECEHFWATKLKVSPTQFMKTIITATRNRGTYTRKVKHGVLTVYFHNTKARNILNQLIEKRRN